QRALEPDDVPRVLERGRRRGPVDRPADEPVRVIRSRKDEDLADEVRPTVGQRARGQSAQTGEHQGILSAVRNVPAPRLSSSRANVDAPTGAGADVGPAARRAADEAAG